MNTISQARQSWSVVQARLADVGLNELALIDANDLPTALREASDLVSVGRAQRLLLLGATGDRFWRSLVANDELERADPFDEVVIEHPPSTCSLKSTLGSCT